MTEERLRCSGTGPKHATHFYSVNDKKYLEKEKWTVTCRPFIVETREVSEWTPVGPPHPSLFSVGEGEWISEK